MAAKTFYQQSNSPSQNAAMTQIATTLQFEMTAERRSEIGTAAASQNMAEENAVTMDNITIVRV
jgi:hypothetical protein